MVVSNPTSTRSQAASRTSWAASGSCQMFASPSWLVLPGTPTAPPITTIRRTSCGSLGSSSRASPMLVSGPTATRVSSPGAWRASRTISTAARSPAGDARRRDHAGIAETVPTVDQLRGLQRLRHRAGRPGVHRHVDQSEQIEHGQGVPGADLDRDVAVGDGARPQPCPLAGGVEDREGIVDPRVTVEQQVDGHAGTPPSGLGRATGEGGREARPWGRASVRPRRPAAASGRRARDRPRSRRTRRPPWRRPPGRRTGPAPG